MSIFGELAARPRWILASAALAATLALGTSAAGRVVAAGAPVDGDAGAIALVSPTSGGELNQGDRETRFVVQLPPAAACPGDSANDDWRVQSFLLPDGTDPLQIEYEGDVIVGATGWPLYGGDTVPYTNQMTGANERPGQPGLINEPRRMTFAVLDPGTLTDGRYRIGIGCSVGIRGQIKRYWDAQIEISGDRADDPGAMRWTVVEAAAPAESGGRRGLIVAGAVVVLAVAGAVLVFNRRGRTLDMDEPVKELR